MISHWTPGRAVIDQMLADRQLERVTADRDLADLNIEHANRHVAAAVQIQTADPAGAFNLAYDGARKAFVAILENQGLRVTAAGGHRAVEEAARAQLVPPLGTTVANFGWMRVTRNATEYVTFDHPVADASDATRAIAAAQDIVAKCEILLDQMPVY